MVGKFFTFRRGWSKIRKRHFISQDERENKRVHNKSKDACTLAPLHRDEYLKLRCLWPKEKLQDWLFQSFESRPVDQDLHAGFEVVQRPAHLGLERLKVDLEGPKLQPGLEVGDVTEGQQHDLGLPERTRRHGLFGFLNTEFNGNVSSLGRKFVQSSLLFVVS